MTLHQSDTEAAIVETARRVLPAGGFGNTASEVVIREGKGGRVWDASGNAYVDFLLGSGPMLVGHAHPDVNRAVLDQVPRGTTFFANNEHGIRLAEAVVEAVPCAEKVRFVSTGSEADLYAMRLARAYRKRDKILKFEGGYHGMSDYGLMSLWPTRPGNFPQAAPDSAGIPASLRQEMLVAPFNDLDAASALVAEHRDELAGVIVEPMQRSIPPRPGFLQGLRELTARHGIPLIFDEVVTGFRFAYGGAQAYYGVTPDLCTLGKVIGGGFPLAAIAGRADIMAHFDRGAVGEAGFLPQIGTLSGNPIAAVAGLATLDVLRRPGTYERLFATGRTLMEGLRSRLEKAGVKARVTGEPPLFDVVFADGEMRDYRDTARGDAQMMRRFNQVLRENGVLKGDSKFYISLAHDERDIATALAAFDVAAAALAG
ncbi:aminotransferase class III-fold pyridoxal phosphate-dependent enzyme [Vineibacter terrae]|uniref:Glutamate-1-semialdehyde 2,1-aminomutase n=1 Tax=Vineibacter terrae TaxID=2586908 RepID=A0A5C8PFF7_9HYPH|nr:aminotransferase class III-fold pyridoxal phosphate-dependent enzyme [Vineibacter terrae]TXL71894.1 aminotransferase class III-fold pyridoxal phosphate-dependent enzyme [Vineibacter terrae]